MLSLFLTAFFLAAIRLCLRYFSRFALSLSNLTDEVRAFCSVSLLERLVLSEFESELDLLEDLTSRDADVYGFCRLWMGGKESNLRSSD